MNWPHYADSFTAVDLLESGACIDGVKDAVAAHGVLAALTADHVANGYVALATCADGSGSGYGSGDGYGSGYGSGYGDGYGYGSGYGV